MRLLFAAALSLGLTSATVAAAASGAYGTSAPSASQMTPTDVPHCDRPLGTVAIKEPERDFYTELGLSSPEAPIKLFILRSGCYRLVDRNAGLAMRNQESALNSSGDLQRGSNIGRGQVLAADFFIVPDIARSNNNQSGGNIGAAFGRFLPGAAGAFVGGINVQTKEANVLLTLVDARTTEQLYIAEGGAKKTDVGFGAGAGWGSWSGFGALAGSGYTNTDIGQVIMAAYFNAFVDMVHYAQNQQPGAQQASAPQAAQKVTRDVFLRADHDMSAPIKFTLHPGDAVYPTPAEHYGAWMEVDTENGIRGWMFSAYATPR